MVKKKLKMQKTKEFREKIFILYGKVLKGDIKATKEFKEIYYQYYPDKKGSPDYNRITHLN